jgi:hypothetical protein
VLDGVSPAGEQLRCTGRAGPLFSNASEIPSRRGVRGYRADARWSPGLCPRRPPRAKRTPPTPPRPAQYGRNEYWELPAKSQISSEESANVPPVPTLPTSDQYRGYVWGTVDFICVSATVAVATRSTLICVADLWRQPEAESAGPQTHWGPPHPNCGALICRPRSGCVHPGALTCTQSHPLLLIACVHDRGFAAPAGRKPSAASHARARPRWRSLDSW